MLTLITILVLLLITGIAARYWGFDSTDRIESREWQRRQCRGEFL